MRSGGKFDAKTLSSWDFQAGILYAAYSKPYHLLWVCPRRNKFDWNQGNVKLVNTLKIRHANILKWSELVLCEYLRMSELTGEKQCATVPNLCITIRETCQETGAFLYSSLNAIESGLAHNVQSWNTEWDKAERSNAKVFGEKRGYEYKKCSEKWQNRAGHGTTVSYSRNAELV